MEVKGTVMGLAAGLAALAVILLNGCYSMESSSGEAGTTRTNEYDASTPVYRIDPPTIAELAGVYKSQDKNYRDSTITIFEDGEFIWHSRTDTLQIFRGRVYNVNSSGFSVGLSDRSGAFTFRFSPDKRSFFSIDQYGQTVEEYRTGFSVSHW
jgi:hypothetical protein